jgi:hypothetical protein|nr:MAG TPA: hypothetical protein [Caudoviricetes sp.]
MKLILKNKQEIQIESMNNAFSFEKFKDGNGNELNYDSIITFYASENESFSAVKAKISNDGNGTDFILVRGNEKRDFPGWKIEAITEDMSDKNKVIIIKLGKM